MLDEVGYTELLGALRKRNRINSLFLRSYQRPVRVNVELSRQIKRWAVLSLTPLNLIKMWHDQRAVFNGFSLVIATASGEQRACISRCADGTIQSALCSDTTEDMKNCLELTTLRCGSSESKRGPDSDIAQMNDALVMELRKQYEER